jgi:hypothetical protein
MAKRLKLTKLTVSNLDRVKGGNGGQFVNDQTEPIYQTDTCWCMPTVFERICNQ